MTTNARFALLSDAEMDEDQRRVAKAIVNSPRKGIRGPFPALLRRPDLADATRLLGDCIRYKSDLADRVRELAILMVVRHWNVDVEWASHKKIALEAGLTESVLDSLERGSSPTGLTAEEAAAYDATRELLDRQPLSDGAYAKAVDAFGEVGVVDLLGTVAYYNYICVLMNGIASPPAR
jgi:4-carboxymuconolactone decarboxylase